MSMIEDLDTATFTESVARDLWQQCFSYHTLHRPVYAMNVAAHRLLNGPFDLYVSTNRGYIVYT